VPAAASRWQALGLSRTGAWGLCAEAQPSAGKAVLAENLPARQNLDEDDNDLQNTIEHQAIKLNSSSINCPSATRSQVESSAPAESEEASAAAFLL